MKGRQKTFSTVRPRRWLNVGSLVALSAIVTGSVMAIGAVHPGTLALVFLVAVGWGSVLLLHQGVGRERGLLLVILGLAAFTIVQATPLPARWLNLLASENASIYAEALRPWRLPGPAHHPLSLDPQASWVEAARLGCYGATLLIAGRVVYAYGTLAVHLVLFGTALLLAVTTYTHGILEATAVFGIYEPRYATARWLSPLLNPNNLAGYLNLGLFCGGAILTSRRAAPFRVLIIVSMAIVLSLSLLCGSRGALVSLVLGSGLLLFHYRRRLMRSPWQVWLQVGAGLVAVVVLSVAAPWEALRGYRVTSTKLDLFRWVVRLIEHHPWFGVGRGAFETVFPFHRDASLVNTSNNVTFAHAENFPLQWAAEWGIPVALLGLVGIGFAAWRWGRRSSGASFAIIGASMLLLQNLVDVAFEVPAVCIALCALAAVFFASEGRAPVGPRLGRDRRLFAGASAVVVAVTLLLSWRISRLDTVTQARDRMRGLYAQTAFHRADSARLFDEALRGEVLERPAEPYFHLLGAGAARRTNAEPNRWLSRALERDPNRAETYLILGRILAERGFVRQGLDMMQHAVRKQPSLARRVARTAVRITSDPALVVRIAPTGAEGCATLTEAGKRLPQSQAPRFLALAVDRSPQCGELAVLHATASVAKLEAGGEPCSDKGACIVEAERALTLAEQSGSPAGPLKVIKARLLAVKRGPKEALAFLSGACTPIGEDVECSRVALRLAARGGPEEFTRLAKEFLAASCSENADCVKAEQLVGDLAAERGDWLVALSHHERAATLSGSAAVWRRYSAVAKRAGASGRAADALERARRYEGREPTVTPRPDQPTDDDL